MGHVPLARIEEAATGDFRFVLYNRASAEELSRVARLRRRPIKVHLKIETGTYRQGVDEDEIPWFLDYLRRHPELHVEGIYTHFANIEDTTDHTYANYQLRRYEEVVARFRDAGLAPLTRHAACSAASLVVPQTHFEMVRLGISQYGLWPSKETLLSYKLQHQASQVLVLRPVLTWKTRISQIKQVPAGTSVGYGCAYQTTRKHAYRRAADRLFRWL